ncbi:MAG: hypothetical protein FJ293_08335 [Planctomycetes bacterium]|nr:hypothetical protein [Planctomycetota bacterium]
MSRRIAGPFAAAAAVALLCSAGAVSAAAQERPPTAEADADKARQLILRIRSTMRQVDSLLLRGGGTGAEQALAESQRLIAQLLDESEQKAGAIVSDIDQLIEISKRQSGC